MVESEDQEQELDLSRFFAVFMRRRWIIAAVAILMFAATAFVTLTTRPVYQASAMLIIEKERSGGNNGVNSSASIESNNDDYYQTQYKLLRSLSLARRVHESLQLGADEEFGDPHGPEKMLGKVAISPVLRSRLLYVRVESRSPEKAARIANAFSETFVQQNLSNQLFIAKDVLQALQFKQEGANARQTYEALPAVVNSGLINSLKTEYIRLQAQAADYSARYTPKHPAMIAIQSNMTALREQIRDETDKIVQSLKTQLSGQLMGNNVRIVDPAQVPEVPIKPKKLQMLLLGLLGGLILGVGAAFLIEMLDQTIRSQEDVEQKMRQPFLGMVPKAAKLKGPAYAPLLAKELSLTSEAVRNLRTMVDFAGVSQKSRAMLVTSSVQAEGKSHIASNLAVAFAQMGESVLLIDGDLRRPNIHKIFGLSAQLGLSNFLAASKSAAEAEALLQDTEVPNLKALVCGPQPPNPSELLNTPRLGALTAWARERFDRVIVDCTPMFPINDTLLWGRHVSAGVFVVRYGKTRAPLVLNACKKLSSGGIKVLGAVVNAAELGGISYAAYGYTYQQYYRAYAHQESAPSKTA